MNEFDCDYYENGLKTGQSCYVNYRWLPELTIKMAHHIVKHLKLKESETVLDFGCAKGYLVKALRILDIPACGCDISDYAVNQVDADTKTFCRLIEDKNILFPFENKFDWIISKDVLEHMSETDLEVFLTQASAKTEKMFHIVPLGDGKSSPFRNINWIKPTNWQKTKSGGLKKFEDAGWIVEVFDYNIKGIKDNWTGKYPLGNGFFILKKGM